MARSVPSDGTFLGEWSITAWYLALLFAFGAPAKLISAARSTAPVLDRVKYLLIGPTLSMRTWSDREPVTFEAVRGMVLPGLATAGLLAGYYAWGGPRLADGVWLAGYISIVPLYLLIDTLGNVIRLGYLPFGALPPIHDRPWAAAGLSDFWGRRWNRWIADWLFEATFQPLKRRRELALFAAFIASGLLHEYLTALPYYLKTDRSLFGLMLLYFVVQAAGVAIERRWLRGRPFARRLFAWAVILLPAPLVMNEASLLIFGFAR